jgi:putative DNA primase/helicase
MSIKRFDVKDAQGRWRGILSALGVSQKALSSKHTECPICQGGPKSDSFRFDDKDGRGTWICTHDGAGDGFALVMKMRGVDFKGACEIVAPIVGSVAFEPPKAKTDTTPEAKEEMTALWRRARPLDGKDLASRYLQGRGISREAWPAAMRFIDELPYSEGDIKRFFPAMLAKFSAPDGKSALLHRTWLDEPGHKANVDPCRKFFRGSIPAGGAVRLSMVAECMGVAEGIETALSATAIAQIPVWAACTAGELVKFVPPVECRHLIIFADSDPSFTGQLAAYSLARKLVAVPVADRIGVEVRFPQFYDNGEKCDFNDVLLQELEAAK